MCMSSWRTWVSFAVRAHACLALHLGEIVQQGLQGAELSVSVEHVTHYYMQRGAPCYVQRGGIMLHAARFSPC
jgi:hypothetical protein